MHGNTGRVISDVSQHEMVFESFHLSLKYFFSRETTLAYVILGFVFNYVLFTNGVY